MPISTAIAASTFTALNSRNCCVGLRLLMKSISLFMCTVAAFPLTLSLSLRERIPPGKSSRIGPLNRSSRRKEALISLSPRSLSLLTSAATNEGFTEREDHFPRCEKPRNSEYSDRRVTILPLPKGEGWGEGKENFAFVRRQMILMDQSERHTCTGTPVSPSPAQVRPLKAGTSFAIWLNKPSIVTKP